MIKKSIISVIFLVFVILLPIFSEKTPTLTVLDFQTNNISDNDMRSITSFLSASLFDTGAYRVIDSSQRDTILKELEFSYSGCTDEECQLEIGRLLSAEIVVVGDIAKLGNRYVFTARMIATETSETLSTSRAVYPDMDNLIDGMDIFAGELVSQGGALKTAEAPEEAQVVIPDTSTRQPPNGKRIAAWATLGAGIAASGAGGYFIYDALTFKRDEVDIALAAYNDKTVTDFGTLTPEEFYNARWNSYIDAFDIYKGKSLTALFLTGGGILSLGVSAALFLIPDNNGNDLSFLFWPSPEACSFRCSLRL